MGGAETAAAAAIAALAAAWLVYRLERAAARRRQVSSARAVLLGVWRGMVEGHAGGPGWGELYVMTNDAEGAATAAASIAQDAPPARYARVPVLPTAPLAALISSAHAGDLVSAETIYFANIGLWHLEVFNQLVVQQSHLVAQYDAKVFEKKLGERRRSLIARAIGSQASVSNRAGVGEPFADGSWYRQLRESLEVDIARLDAERGKRWYPAGERRLAFGDAAAALAVLALAGVLLATNIGGGARVPHPQQLPTLTDPYR